MPPADQRTEGKATDIYGETKEVEAPGSAAGKPADSTIDAARRTDALPEDAREVGQKSKGGGIA